ncbi:5-carboxymethyl-2-hydroxymuconate Delta-isomerase [Streptomyces sp. NPDC059740]|uniref:5-carboxymethyl-2-hydroxymuconate Delta-isomerase n=1 Tax=Streptomyces sp. NPDC059740 TaxID=3346926 RepID=UPI0036585652
MPHITVDYSPQLTEVFDRAALVRELHPVVRETTATAGVCKTFFRPAAETYVGEADAGRPAFVHVEIGLLPGRTDALKQQLSEDVLTLLEKHLHTGAGAEVVTSVEVRDLTSAYRLRHAGGSR